MAPRMFPIPLLACKSNTNLSSPWGIAQLSANFRLKGNMVIAALNKHAHDKCFQSFWDILGEYHKTKCLQPSHKKESSVFSKAHLTIFVQK